MIIVLSQAYTLNKCESERQLMHVQALYSEGGDPLVLSH
jgi:hypothetical protein